MIRSQQQPYLGQINPPPLTGDAGAITLHARQSVTAPPEIVSSVPEV